MLRKSLFLLTAFSLATPALAAPSCEITPRQQKRLDRFADKLEGASSVEEAQQLAMEEVKPARGVLAKASKLAPKDEGLADARARLVEFEAGIDGASSKHEIASTFRSLHTAGGCSMSVGEVIATVLGFILGIIPGVILLILLC